VAGFEPALDGFEAVAREGIGREIREESTDLPAPVVVVSSAKPRFFTTRKVAAQVKRSSKLAERFFNATHNRRADLFALDIIVRERKST